MTLIAKALDKTGWLFDVPAGERSWLDVVGWWEKRRFAYNVFLILVGILTGILFVIVDALPPQAENTDWSPLLTAVLALVVANFCYTLGWVVELLAKLSTGRDNRSLGPKLLKAGLWFSAVVACVPVVMNLVFWIGRIIE